MIDSQGLVSSGCRTINIESEAVSALQARIGDSFVTACRIILECKGRVVVTGMGKSGHIGGKIAATLASTGTPSFFMHPAEASHGDIGMLTESDVMLAISNSGTTSEVVTLLPLIRRRGIKVVSMTGDPGSTLATRADAHLDVSVETEACPLDLAPTSSTTATLAMGDALAVALLEARGFTPEDFAFSHPGGALGRKLLLKVQDIMHRDSEVPSVAEDTALKNALLEMTAKGFGMTTVVDSKGELLGVYTDGDLRRSIEQGVELDGTSVGEVMSRNPHTVSENLLAAEALKLMQDARITAIIVEDDSQSPTGVLHMHDILRAGVL